MRADRLDATSALRAHPLVPGHPLTRGLPALPHIRQVFRLESPVALPEVGKWTGQRLATHYGGASAVEFLEPLAPALRRWVGSRGHHTSLYVRRIFGAKFRRVPDALRILSGRTLVGNGVRPNQNHAVDQARTRTAWRSDGERVM